MKMKYPQAIAPAHLTRKLNADEVVAMWASHIIADEGDPQLYYAQSRIGDAPSPNKSARVSYRAKGGMEQTVVVSASAQFFAEVRAWVARLDASDIFA